ncbi:restriction endonuclease [Aeromicrobium fastidiosum]|uniref:Restriction endonuclease n=2 Tax=Aeromicrobium fastidiosum TaxID=52699 RepID=A0A641AP92_9ACTN|nr:restriction endonuclease [Aeromicrobium fastidiosum]
MDIRWPAVGEVLRYSKGADRSIPELNGFTNFHYLTRDPEVPTGKRILLESGINRVSTVTHDGVERRPLLALRSSPWKAGVATTPWQDVFSLDYGHVRYFGDHKVSTMGPVGSTPGNGALLEAWNLHASPVESERLDAPPILIFRAVPQFIGNVRVDKGYVDFCGVAVIERLEHVVQKDPITGITFPNIVVDLCVVDLSDREDRFDFRWIDDRRNPELSSAQTLRHAPDAWERWTREGKASISRVRRRVISSRVLAKSDQQPPAGSDQADVLERIYHQFDDNKHAFESLAARVAGRVLGSSGASYRDGWITKAGGDGGLDFVGRLDIGFGGSTTPIVVLGQAKCKQTSSSISPDEVARLVARLKRGWVGVFVTTGSFSRQAQIEIVDDQYPVVLIHGKTLVEEVLNIAAESFGGDVDAFLASAFDAHATSVAHRRPEEILLA